MQYGKRSKPISSLCISIGQFCDWKQFQIIGTFGIFGTPLIFYWPNALGTIRTIGIFWSIGTLLRFCWVNVIGTFEAIETFG